MLYRNLPLVLCLTVAAGIVSAATLLRLAFTPVLDHAVPFIFYFPAVVMCAWIGGLRAGLPATVLAAIVSWYLFFNPSTSGAPGSTAMQLALFIASGWLISLLAEDLHRAKSSAEASRLEAERNREQLRVTLSGIGDGVISTDGRGRITFLNGVAQRLTGWSADEAHGKAIQDVFRIIDEETRETCVDPVARACREGTTTGLTNRVLLLAKDGREVPIDDSAAPIRNAEAGVAGAVLVFRDDSERRRADEAASRLAAIIESSDDAIVGKNLDGVITSWNRGAERIFGFSAGEIVGKHITTLIPPELHSEENAILERLRHGERVDHFESIRRRKDGALLTVSITVSPIRDRSGRIVGASKVARDITDRKRAEQQLERLLRREQSARARAEEASQLKDEFLATVSHELRTPLNAIIGWVALLRGDRLDGAAARKALDIIQRNARAQAQIIGDILDVSRIITGRLRLEVRPVDPAAAVDTAIASIGPAAAAKDVRIHRSVDAGAGPVTADPERLQQILWNLLSNAVKFTHSRGNIHVRLEPADLHVQIAVIDDGQGISPDFLPYVFDRFRQADSSTARAHGGLGLGLSIVRHLVELHGGTVSADSPGEGQGATFVVRLPKVAIREEAREQAILPAPAANLPEDEWDLLPVLDGIRVLVVDDELDARLLLRTILEKCRAEVAEAASADEAIRRVMAARPDVLISDLGMPGRDGYALIEAIRALEDATAPALPAVAVTAHARDEDRLRALSAGYQMHIPKPINPVEVGLVIARLAGRTPKGSRTADSRSETEDL